MITSLRNRASRGFTLVELLIVLLIVAIIAGMSISALAGAAEEGRRQRARVQIAKLDALIMEKWNSYRFRQVPIKLPGGSKAMNLLDANRVKLFAMRKLMRCEMPDRMTDVVRDSVISYPYYAKDGSSQVYNIDFTPALGLRYKNVIANSSFVIANGSPNITNEQAECLYLILAEMRDGDRSALNFLLPSEVGDTDNDGLKEALDPWGTPIRFLRWAPGHSKGIPDWTSGAYSLTPATTNQRYEPPTNQSVGSDDPLDPLRVDARWTINAADLAKFPPYTYKPFQLKPLIYSAGPDRSFDVQGGYYNGTTSDFSYDQTKIVLNDSTSVLSPNDPYYIHVFTGGPNANKPASWLGACVDIDGDGRLSYADNITNHGLTLEGG